MLNKNISYIVYDGECPFCSNYVHLLRLKDAMGPVELVNARSEHPAVKYVEDRGVVLDQEMALVTGNEIYSGPECINRLALMSTSSGVFNRLNGMIFSSKGVARLAYPVLRFGRNAVLRILGVKKIRA